MSAAQYTLTWTDQANDEDGFRIERKRGATGAFLEIATVGPGVTSFVDAGLDDGPSFCYRVRAFNVVGVSAPSNQACAPLTAVLDVKLGVDVEPSVESSVTLAGADPPRGRGRVLRHGVQPRTREARRRPLRGLAAAAVGCHLQLPRRAERCHRAL